MNELYKKAINAYIEMLSIHISTKTEDVVFHWETENFYEILFNVAHEIWEKHVDLWNNILNSSIDEKKKKAYAIIKNIREEIEQYKKSNNVTLGTEDLLWSLANDLENIEWTSRSFIK